MTAKNDLPYHELFELPEGESPKNFPPPPNFNAIKIWVSRIGGPHGVVKCPRPFLLSEIPDMMAFHDMFGGGRYMVEGRTLGGQFYARRDFVLDGPPKPMVQTDPADVPQAQQAQAPGFSMPGMTGGIGDAFQAASGNPMALLFLVMMQNADRAEQRAERQATQSIENMKLIATMFGGQRSGTDPAVAQAFGHMTELVRTQIAASAAPQSAPQRTVEEEMRRAQDLILLAKKMSPTETPEKFTDIVKEILTIVPPELAQSVAASLMGGNGVTQAPVVVEGVMHPVG